VGKIEKGVSSDQKEQPIVLAQLSPHRPHRVDGVARRPVHGGRLNGGGDKSPLAGAGHSHHRIALSIIGQVIVYFVWRIPGGDEKNSIQMKAVLRRPRRRQVPGMDGVKRSAKNSDVHDNREIG
jgi:hypothetical protein